MNNCVHDLGETNILEDSYLEYKRSSKKDKLAIIYYNQYNNVNSRLYIKTNKFL